MRIFDPWEEYKNKQLFANMKIKQTTLICNTQNLQGIKKMVLDAPLSDTYLNNCKLEWLEKLSWSQ